MSQLDTIATYIRHTHVGSQSGRVENVAIALTYAGNLAEIDLAFEVPLDGRNNESIARELRRLGEA